MSDPKITVIMPALNEENNIRAAISSTLDAFDRYALSGELLVVNDGSTDRTGEIAAEFQRRDARIQILHHEKPRGIGGSFWDGLAHARGEAICMLPGDNENDPGEILRYYPLLDHVDIVIPFVFARRNRTPFRRMLSRIYSGIIALTFGVSFKYTNGTVMYRRKSLEALDFHDPSFFFQTDILVRMAKIGYLCAEVPYWIYHRTDGVSKAITLRSLWGVMVGYSRLFRDLYLQGNKPRQDFLSGTQTEMRYMESLRASQQGTKCFPDSPAKSSDGGNADNLVSTNNDAKVLEGHPDAK